MLAMTYSHYGPASVLQPADVAMPKIKSTEIIVRVQASTVTPVDCQFRAGDPPIVRLYMGLFRPKKRTVLGSELSGRVEAIGDDVSEFEVGDHVFAATADGTGGHAEYIALPAKGAVTHIPENMSLAQAATLCNGGLTALPFLRDHGRIKPGDRVLIIGASGSIGTCAIELAKHFGAHVTGVCSAANVELVASLGADAVIDYNVADFTRLGQKYDIIFDTVAKSSFANARSALKPNGAYLVTAPSFATVFHMLRAAAFGGKRAVMAATGLRPAGDQRRDMDFLKKLAETGVLRSIIDRTYPFAELAKAHEYVETGHKKGNVVVTMV